MLVDQVLNGFEQLLAYLGGDLAFPLDEGIRGLCTDLHLEELGLLGVFGEVEGLKHRLYHSQHLGLVHLEVHLAH